MTKRFIIEGVSRKTGKGYVSPISFHSRERAQAVIDYSNRPLASGRPCRIFWYLFDQGEDHA